MMAPQLPVRPDSTHPSSPFTPSSLPTSPLLGQPGYVVPEEDLPLASHLVKVTAFQGGEQVGSGEVTVQTCKLTATSPLKRESVPLCM